MVEHWVLATPNRRARAISARWLPKSRFVMCPIFGTASRATCVGVGGGAMREQRLLPGDQSGTVATLAIAVDQDRAIAP